MRAVDVAHMTPGELSHRAQSATEVCIGFRFAASHPEASAAAHHSIGAICAVGQGYLQRRGRRDLSDLRSC